MNDHEIQSLYKYKCESCVAKSYKSMSISFRKRNNISLKSVKIKLPNGDEIIPFCVSNPCECLVLFQSPQLWLTLRSLLKIINDKSVPNSQYNLILLSKNISCDSSVSYIDETMQSLSYRISK